MADQNYSMNNQGKKEEGGNAQTPDQSNLNPQLNKRQKIAAAFLVIFACLVMVLWYAQFRQGLKGSLVQVQSPDQEQPGSNSGSIGASQTCSGPDCQNDEARLRAQDTDGDGISDWDELNTYQTSPYLEDSDSDGFTDKQEIDSGNDPNCPVGADCAASAPITPPAADNGTGSAGLDNITSELDQLNRLQAQSQTQSTTDTSAAADAFAGLDPAGLRQLLLDNGMDPQLLSQISDEELMKNFQETLAGN